jgi:hypothetical protein
MSNTGERPSFSLHDFKGWLAEQKDMSEFFNIEKPLPSKIEGFIGMNVIPKVGLKKLLEKAHADDGDAEQMVHELMEDGGVIVDIKGKELLVEVDSGCFYIHRFCVRLVKDEE